jgi:hypothetical protein
VKPCLVCGDELARQLDPGYPVCGPCFEAGWRWRLVRVAGRTYGTLVRAPAGRGRHVPKLYDAKHPRWQAGLWWETEEPPPREARLWNLHGNRPGEPVQG